MTLDFRTNNQQTSAAQTDTNPVLTMRLNSWMVEALKSETGMSPDARDFVQASFNGKYGSLIYHLHSGNNIVHGSARNSDLYVGIVDAYKVAQQNFVQAEIGIMRHLSSAPSDTVYSDHHCV